MNWVIYTARRCASAVYPVAVCLSVRSVICSSQVDVLHRINVAKYPSSNPITSPSLSRLISFLTDTIRYEMLF